MFLHTSLAIRYAAIVIVLGFASQRKQPQQAKSAGNCAGLGLSPEELFEDVQRLTVSVQGMHVKISRCQPMLQVEESFAQQGQQATHMCYAILHLKST